LLGVENGGALHLDSLFLVKMNRAHLRLNSVTGFQFPLGQPGGWRAQASLDSKPGR